ncbi:hypothetical protein FACS1894186_8460 [Alphaproteobacteria bacterium]|nr:hypothetical protein FACS1894186_8460 [Alphaproteobacteria bacterium]
MRVLTRKHEWLGWNTSSSWKPLGVSLVLSRAGLCALSYKPLTDAVEALRPTLRDLMNGFYKEAVKLCDEKSCG